MSLLRRYRFIIVGHELPGFSRAEMDTLIYLHFSLLCLLRSGEIVFQVTDWGQKGLQGAEGNHCPLDAFKMLQK